MTQEPSTKHHSFRHRISAEEIRRQPEFRAILLSSSTDSNKHLVVTDNNRPDMTRTSRPYTQSVKCRPRSSSFKNNNNQQRSNSFIETPCKHSVKFHCPRASYSFRNCRESHSYVDIPSHLEDNVDIQISSKWAKPRFSDKGEKVKSNDTSQLTEESSLVMDQTGRVDKDGGVDQTGRVDKEGGVIFKSDYAMGLSVLKKRLHSRHGHALNTNVNETTSSKLFCHKTRSIKKKIPSGSNEPHDKDKTSIQTLVAEELSMGDTGEGSYLTHAQVPQTGLREKRSVVNSPVAFVNVADEPGGVGKNRHGREKHHSSQDPARFKNNKKNSDSERHTHPQEIVRVEENDESNIIIHESNDNHCRDVCPVEEDQDVIHSTRVIYDGTSNPKTPILKVSLSEIETPFQNESRDGVENSFEYRNGEKEILCGQINDALPAQIELCEDANRDNIIQTTSKMNTQQRANEEVNACRRDNKSDNSTATMKESLTISRNIESTTHGSHHTAWRQTQSESERVSEATTDKDNLDDEITHSSDTTETKKKKKNLFHRHVRRIINVLRFDKTVGKNDSDSKGENDKKPRDRNDFLSRQQSNSSHRKYDAKLEKSAVYLRSRNRTFTRASQYMQSPSSSGLRQLNVHYSQTNSCHNDRIIFTDLLKNAHVQNAVLADNVFNMERRLYNRRHGKSRNTTFYDRFTPDPSGVKQQRPHSSPQLRGQQQQGGPPKSPGRTVADKKKERKERIQRKDELIELGYVPRMSTMETLGPEVIEDILMSCRYLRVQPDKQPWLYDDH